MDIQAYHQCTFKVLLRYVIAFFDNATLKVGISS